MITMYYSIAPTFPWCTYSKLRQPASSANESKATQAYDHPFGSSLEHITWMQHCLLSLCSVVRTVVLLYLTRACAIQDDFCLPAASYAVI